jgi:hypothetical protein
MAHCWERATARGVKLRAEVALMGCVIHEEAQLELRAPSKDHATSTLAGYWVPCPAPETLVAEILVTGGEPAEFSGASLTDSVSP